MMQNSTNDSYFIFTTLDDFKHGLRKEFKQKSMTEDLNGKGLKRFQCGNCWKLYSTKRDLKSRAGSILIEIEKSTILAQFSRIEMVTKSIFEK